MICPTCSQPTVLEAVATGQFRCDTCVKRWTSAAVATDLDAAVATSMTTASFPGDVVDVTRVCGGCSGVGTVEQHVNPLDPSEGFETIDCPACGGKGRQL